MTEDTPTPTPPDTLREIVAANIRVEAARAGLNITALGELTGHGRHWVDRRWHARHDFSLDDIDELAAAIGCSTNSLTHRP